MKIGASCGLSPVSESDSLSRGPTARSGEVVYARAER
jgi:hypothetical protein